MAAWLCKQLNSWLQGNIVSSQASYVYNYQSNVEKVFILFPKLLQTILSAFHLTALLKTKTSEASNSKRRLNVLFMCY